MVSKGSRCVVRGCVGIGGYVSHFRYFGDGQRILWFRIIMSLGREIVKLVMGFFLRMVSRIRGEQCHYQHRIPFEACNHAY